MAAGQPLGSVSFLIAIAFAVSGCSAAGSIKQSGGSELVAAERAMVMPPPGGPAIIGVVQKTYKNGLEQTLSLATSSSVAGQNYLKVVFTGGHGDGSSELSYRSFSEGALSREIARAAPGVRLSRSPAFLQNSYGPFGYAVGHGRNGDVCLYGWQQIRSGSQNRGTPKDLGMVQVKLRLCDNRATDQELLSVLYGYTITGSFEGQLWNPFGRPSAIDLRIGKPGQPIYPASFRNANDFTFGYPAGPIIEAEPRRVRTPLARDMNVAAPIKPEVSPSQDHPQVPLPGGNAEPVPRFSTSDTHSVDPSPNSTAGTVPSPDCLGAVAKTAGCK